MFLVRDEPTGSPAIPAEEAVTGVADFDPFTPPTCVTPIALAEYRARVAIAGTVTAVAPIRWVGGDALGATLDDGTGAVTLAFLGRREIAGIEPGRTLTAGGTVGRRDGRLLILNPFTWLTAPASVAAAPAVAASERPAGGVPAGDVPASSPAPGAVRAGVVPARCSV
jgi:hypothetical protein